MAEFDIRINEVRCIGCWECVDLCPQTGRTDFPVYLKGERAPKVANPESCLGCLTCEWNCRAEAITVMGKGRPERVVDRRAETKEKALF